MSFVATALATRVLALQWLHSVAYYASSLCEALHLQSLPMPFTVLDPAPTLMDLSALETILVELLLSPKAQRQYQLGAIAKEELQPYAAAIVELSRRYVDRPGGAPPPRAPLTPLTARAYALYYALINAPKVGLLLSALEPPPAATPLRVLDFGCGPGTASFAALDLLPRPLQIHAVDESPAMRTLAEQLVPSYATRRDRREVTFECSEGGWESSRYDLVIAANVLNEASERQAQQLAKQLVSVLSPHGSLVLVEPALQSSTRALMKLRDELLETYHDLIPRFPCTRRDACPMRTASSTDWCHGELRWERPQLVQQLDQLSGFNKHRAKLSALALQRGAAPLEGVRVVGTPHGAGHLYLCGTERYERVSPHVVGRRLAKKLRGFERLTVAEEADRNESAPR